MRNGRAAVSGIVLVAVVVVVLSLNTTAYRLFTQPIERWLEDFTGELIAHAIICTGILVSAIAVRRWVPRNGSMPYAVGAVAVAAATLFGLAVVFATSEGGVFDEPWPGSTRKVILFATEAVRYSLLGAVITCAWLYLRAEADYASTAAQVAIDAERMDRETAEARLQMLEAQIEPHFLFNTLAHVRRLYETDQVAGARMLRNLREYLSIALPSMRADAATLGRELDHVVAYLGIQQVRMGYRLAYAIEVPAGLRDNRLPPLMLLTLVENAIKYGLSPRPQGGRIDMRASLAAGLLRVEVADTGGGFTKSHGGGTGLANIRARLASTYGSDASLSLAVNDAGGVTASLVIPVAVPRAATPAS